MLEQTLDIWKEQPNADAICITTNGFIKNNGRLVMGAGVAGQAQERYPNFPQELGTLVSLHGNHVFVLKASHAAYSSHVDNKVSSVTFAQDWQDNDAMFISFPVKHKWFEDADLELIERSAKELMVEIDRYGFEVVLLPRPGCGNGKLSWDDVKPVLDPILDDRVIAVTASLPSY